MCSYLLLYRRWNHLWAIEPKRVSYPIIKHQDDTIRVVMIGDSWSGMHYENGMDDNLCGLLFHITRKPIIVQSKGNGGEKSKGIYRLMFDNGEYGTKSIFLNGADYCVVFAGINDAAANLGTKQFCAHYRMILDFLLANGIRPVVIEVPDVDIWNIYGDKPKKDLLTDYIKSLMTRCGMYNYHEYREALYSMLHEEQLLDRVVYVSIKDWNGDGVEINPTLFLADKIHLNRKGYEKLDECIAGAIARDLKLTQDSALVNQPVGRNPQ